MRVGAGALTTAGLGAKERPRLHGTRNGSLSPAWPARLHIWNPGNGPGVCFCQVPLRLFLLQRWHLAPNGDRSRAVRKEQQQPTWLGLKADLNNPTPICPSGPAFSSPTGCCLPCNLPTAPAARARDEGCADQPRSHSWARCPPIPRPSV